ncbi:multiple sugar transport system permease protein [Halogranum amylolyticum]|uniref:Multiple sugar transport system permease protein n=1 Tax=Halogranum amylolyticum TaxID=660520 RepID=A0A1H8VKY1_9EURY|nr:sugar ABC transporter permease [Halogranum amylolyticum]SEP16081.1 multiple sugar transport system permease protein [Halogranum amylolyticum]
MANTVNESRAAEREESSTGGLRQRIGGLPVVSQVVDRVGQHDDNLMGYALIAPWFLWASVFLIFPFLFALYLSFHEWAIISPTKPFVGIEHYVSLFTGDLFWQLLKNTLYFFLVNVPTQIVLALGVAVLLDRIIRGRALYMAGYFVPYVTSGVVVAVVFKWLYAPDGYLNQVLGVVGTEINFLGSQTWAMPAIAMMVSWKFIGYYAIIFLANLQSLPENIYESASLDGASEWQQFRYITLPLLNPSILVVVILSTITAFQIFTEPFIMTSGGPNGATKTFVLEIYRNAFSYLEMGYASAMGVILAAMIFVISYVERNYVDQEVSV